MIDTIRKGAMTAAGLGALALGGSAIAGAADSNTTAGSQSYGSNGGQTRPQREELSADVAAKVKAAALEKVPGATVLRTEAGGPYGTPYHAHIKTSDGTLKVVTVNADFEATGVQADRGRSGRGGPGDRGRHGGGPGDHGPGRGETALTGDTKQKVEAAVLAKYDGATIVRSETNGDGSAPYEAHIKTKAGKELEVLVNKSFEVVGSHERPAHR